MLPSLPLHPLHLHFYPCSSHLLTPSLLHITHQVPDRNSVVVPPRLTLRSSLQTLMQTTSPFCHAHLTTWVVLAFSFTASSAFGPASHLSYTLPPKPLWNSPNDFPHSPAFFAFQRSFHAPHSLLPFASRQWRSQTKKKPHRFGSSRSTTSPSQWAIQCLASIPPWLFPRIFLRPFILTHLRTLHLLAYLAPRTLLPTQPHLNLHPNFLPHNLSLKTPKKDDQESFSYDGRRAPSVVTAVCDCSYTVVQC